MLEVGGSFTAPWSKVWPEESQTPQSLGLGFGQSVWVLPRGLCSYGPRGLGGPSAGQGRRERVEWGGGLGSSMTVRRARVCIGPGPLCRLFASQNVRESRGLRGKGPPGGKSRTGTGGCGPEAAEENSSCLPAP